MAEQLGFNNVPFKAQISFSPKQMIEPDMIQGLMRLED